MQTVQAWGFTFALCIVWNWFATHLSWSLLLLVCITRHLQTISAIVCHRSGKSYSSRRRQWKNLRRPRNWESWGSTVKRWVLLLSAVTELQTWSMSLGNSVLILAVFALGSSRSHSEEAEGQEGHDDICKEISKRCSLFGSSGRFTIFTYRFHYSYMHFQFLRYIIKAWSIPYFYF